MSWLQFNAGPNPRYMPLVAIQCRTVRQVDSTSGAPPSCSGETCSLSEETKAPTATATRASCHKARHNWRGLPHPRRRVSSGGALLSSAHVTPSEISAFLNTSSITAVNNLGESGSPCLTPLCIWNTVDTNLSRWTIAVA